MIIQFNDIIKNAPHLPGVYKMYGADDVLLYVGKARDLSARLKQYSDIAKLEPHKQIMRSLVTRIEWETVPTENDALVLEEKLIKSDKPKYNIMLTDGKMYPQIMLTRHEFPRIMKFRGKVSQKRDVFGPYPSVGAMNESLKTIQKVCQLRTCTDGYMRNRTRPCLLYQIGRCSAPCMIKDNIAYSDQVALARRILSGDTAPVINDLSTQMTTAATNMDYEAAAKLRDKIAALSETAIAGKRNPQNKNFDWPTAFNSLETWLGLEIDKAFVFDNSHLFGKSPVGGMIAFDKNGLVKNEYKHFKLKDPSRAGNDIAMMEEFIARAFKDAAGGGLVIVDGGRAQWKAAKKILGDTAPVLGVVKGEVRNGDEHFILPDGTENFSVPKNSLLFLLLRRVRDEAHRFAITFNRARRSKEAFGSALDEIDGIGPTRKRALLHYFGGARGVSNADLKTLEKVPGLGAAAAKKIYSFFHPGLI